MANAGSSKKGQAMRRPAGFTLMEILIVVVMVGFLMMIALPAYQESIRKGRRADAKAGLMSAANREESFMLDRGTYTLDMKELGFEDNPMITEERHYEVATAAVDSVEFEAACPDDATIATCYVLIATPLADDPATVAVDPSPQTEDTRCTKLILDSTGAKSAEGKTKDECW